MIPNIKLYGTASCHKTKYYQNFFENLYLDYRFLDVESNERNAEELRGLYKNRKLNFPTITIGKKRLRNPSESELKKWIEKSI
jgi:arsenate reductase-like glutaredoxin family protein